MRLSSVLVCFLVVALPALGQSPQSQPALSGRWEGAVQIPASPMRLVIDLAQQDQQWVGSLIAPDFGVKGAPLTAIAVKGSDVEFALKHALGEPTFKGHLDSDGMLKGEYAQAGNKAPFQFKRLGDPQVDFPERSTLVGKDLQGEWTGSVQFQGKPLTVILKLPDSGTPTTPSGQLVITDSNTTFPITFWKQEGSNILFTMESANLTFEGELRGNPPEITGVVRQGAFELPLTLHRGAPPNPPAAKPTAPPASK